MQAHRFPRIISHNAVRRNRLLGIAACLFAVMLSGQSGCPAPEPEPTPDLEPTPVTPTAVATPTFSPPNGTAIPDAGLDVAISTSTAGATILYTTDGSEPTSSDGTAYGGAPIHLTDTTTIKAVAYAAGMLDSAVVEATYTRTTTPPTPPPPSPTTIALADGHKIYNVAADFIAYAEQAQGADAAGRTTQWDQMLEANYPDYFNQIVYGNLTGQDREAYKTQVINQFWSDAVPQLDTLRQVAGAAVQKVLDGRTAFKEVFTDFDPQADYYLTVSFNFVGKATEVSGQKAELLALNAFQPDDPELDITIAHEHFHLYHFVTFSPSGGLYRGIWSEGMAVYASTMIWPGYRISQYTGFTGSAIDAMYELFYDLVDDILKNIDTSDQTIKRAYLGTEPNDTWIPPGSGYYIGFFLVQALVDQGNTVADMARWEATPTVHKAIVDTLPTLQQP